VLAAQREYLRDRGYGSIVKNHDSYAEVFGPLLNLLPIAVNEDWAPEFQMPDPDFHFFLASFINASEQTDLTKNHNTWVWCYHIKRILDSTAERKIVTLQQRKELQHHFGKIFEEWHLECFSQKPHEFKRKQSE
jgi:hypothetical protein